MSEQSPGTTTEPEFKRVTTAVVTRSAPDEPHHVDVKPGTRALTADEPVRRGGAPDSGPEPSALSLAPLATLRSCAAHEDRPLDAVRVARPGSGANGAPGRTTRRVARSRAADQAQGTRLPGGRGRTPVASALGAATAVDTTEGAA